jgi:hypothetical protein
MVMDLLRVGVVVEGDEEVVRMEKEVVMIMWYLVRYEIQHFCNEEL